MKSAIIVFPGSNRDKDAADALEKAAGRRPQMVWHGDASLPKVDLVMLPGGFSYGDYLRPGAMAAHSPVMRAVVEHARAGRAVLGVCNGFQVLCEAGLLPGALMRNSGLKFSCRDVFLRIDENQSIFTSRYAWREVIRVPVAHHDGCWSADDDVVARLESEERVAFRYATANGGLAWSANPNGSIENIAGVLNEDGNVLGLMPHPENAIDLAQGSADGLKLFESLVDALS